MNTYDFVSFFRLCGDYYRAKWQDLLQFSQDSFDWVIPPPKAKYTSQDTTADTTAEVCIYLSL